MFFSKIVKLKVFKFVNLRKFMKNRSSLEIEVDAFMDHLPEMLKFHNGKFTVFVGGNPLGFYDSESTAYEEGIKKFGNVPMLLRQVSREYLTEGKYGKQVFIPILAHPELF